jgi:hypothetical protein
MKMGTLWPFISKYVYCVPKPKNVLRVSDLLTAISSWPVYSRIIQEG